MPIKLQTVGEYILLKPVEWKPSNIIEIPDVIKNARSYRQEAEVVSVPPWRIHKKTGTKYEFQVQPGMRVLIHPAHGDRMLRLDGEDFMVVEEKDIVGIIERCGPDLQ
jgi:co-chaperonin GroES (HSP10)